MKGTTQKSRIPRLGYTFRTKGKLALHIQVDPQERMEGCLVRFGERNGTLFNMRDNRTLRAEKRGTATACGNQTGRGKLAPSTKK